ncbi:MAG: 1-deoxy-D-xylulose-5-phosphate synthase [Bacteroidota bacterium]|nr:1-deoxy-D-xylulose-5-phosphate synthase [Bacteroidota bacterium]
MKILKDIHTVDDVRQLPREILPELTTELIQFMKESTRSKAGHMASSEGAASLTVALHFTFQTPKDILIWDVGHQAYIHKIITDRMHRFGSNRTWGGISGFPSRSESPFDPFGTGHSSTSISALAGFSTSGEIQGRKRKHIAVIGDGALTGGMAFEALNHLGTTGQDVLIILNDNGFSIDRNTGALAETGSYENFFTSLGFKYSEETALLDAAQMAERLEVLREQSGPRVWRIRTERPEIMERRGANERAWQDLVGEELIRRAEVDPKLVVITPAMTSGSGLLEFSKRFPERFFDVGIAEQHAVTFSAGLAADGMHPVCVIYSTFAQRAYDQIIHDVALQNLPVTFLLDRSGLVGEDGPTHHGAFDIAFLQPIPNLQILAPATPMDLKESLDMALGSGQPFAIRYPRGPVHKGEVKVIPPGSDLSILAVGPMYHTACEALEMIDEWDISVHRILRIKPLDEQLLREVFLISGTVLVVEEGSQRGGVHSEVLQFAARHGYSHRIEGIGIPDRFIPHGSMEALYQEVSLDAESISRRIREIL